MDFKTKRSTPICDLNRPAGVLENPNFRKWFGDSKVVDQQGKPLVVYHGTKQEFTTFEVGRTTTNFSFAPYETNREGVFFTPNREFANEFSDDKGRTIAAYLKIQNPLDLSEGYPNEFYKKHRDLLSENNLTCMQPHEMWEMLDDGFPGATEFIAAVKGDGYDGLKMVERDREGYLKEVFVAFNPEQIKSATANDGSFDPGNTDITK